MTATGSDGEHRSIGTRHALAAALAVLALLGLVVLTVLVVSSNRQRDAALAAQRKSFEVIILVRSLESTMARAEASLGRYVVSDRETAAEDYDPGRLYVDEWRRAGFSIDRLKQVTRDNPEQRLLSARLRAAYVQRGRLLSEIALHKRYDQKNSALWQFIDAGTDPSLRRITRTFDRIVAVENDLLDQRIGAAQASVDESNRAAKLLLAFAVVLLAGAALLGFSSVQALADRRAARRDADEVARRALDLEEAVAARTRELSLANEALLAEAAERASAESQLRQAQKMDAVGQLTGGIAHDFNNMLAVVIGGLELAKRRLVDDPPETARHIDNAMDGAARAATLTRRLLAFARAEPLLPEPIAPDALIAGMTELLDRTIGERITVATRFAAGDRAVWVDRHQLENALLNLAVNARDAMDGEGTLTISTDMRTLRDGELGTARAGDYVVIAVSDTGCGMDARTLERVFEPFFTTKPVGKGTGLGLSQIFGFVRQSSGEIAIASRPGEGTTVSILLPRYAGSVRPVAVEPPPVVAMADAVEQAAILVVEDDPRVLNATVEALEELGHRPIACPSPDRAAALMAAHPDIRLILSDVLMPGTTGPELIAAIRPRHPHVGVLFVTGYAGDEAATAFGGHDVLRKPFTMAALSGAVNGALAKTSAPPLFATAAAAE